MIHLTGVPKFAKLSTVSENIYQLDEQIFDPTYLVQPFRNNEQPEGLNYIFRNQRNVTLCSFIG